MGAAIVATLFGFLTSPAVADTTGALRGRLTAGGAPVAGSTITIAGEGTRLEAVTDAGGRFAVARLPFGRYTVSAHLAGERDATRVVDVQSGTVETIDLDVRPPAVIGRTTRAIARGPGSSPVSVNTIDRAQIETLPDDRRLERLIETVPGVTRYSYDEPIAHGFHGLTYEIDGVPLPRGTASNFGEIIDPRTIDSLEVFTGAYPAEFGGSRAGAVVNIISRRANLDHPNEGQLTLGASGYGSAETAISQSLKFGNTTVFVAGSLLRSNRGLDSPTFVPVHDASNESTQFVRTVTNLNARDAIAIDVSNSTAQFQIPISTGLNANDPVVNAPSTANIQREYGRSLNVVFTDTSRDGSAYTQIAPWYRLDRITYNGDPVNDTAGFVRNADGSTTPLDSLTQDRRSTFLGLRITHGRAYSTHAVKAGIEGTIENFNGSEAITYVDAQGATQRFLDAGTARGTQTGAYIEDKWTPSRAVSIFAGLRYDHSTGYAGGSQLSPRIEVNAAVGRSDIVHAYYGRLYAAPFLEDTRRAAVVTSGNDPGALPAYDLRPERDSYYEIGIAHTISPSSRAYVNMWKRNVSNVLDTVQLAQTPIQAVFNNTVGIAKGFEGRLEVRWKNRDSLGLSATLSRSQAGGISGGTFLFCPPPASADCTASNNDVTLQPEDHDQAFTATADYTKRVGRDGRFFASFEPVYGTGYPVLFQSGPGRLNPHLTLNAAFGREAAHGAHAAVGFRLNVENLANEAHLIKVNNGFNTTQWSTGLRAGVQLIAPL